MKYVGEPIDKTKYEEIDKFHLGVFEYKAFKPQNEEKRKNHNTFFLKRTIYVDNVHFGELISYIVAQKVGFKSCEVKLYKSPLLQPGKFDIGVLSFVEKSKYDELLNINSIIHQKQQEDPNYKTNKLSSNCIDKILELMFWYITVKNKRPYDEYLAFKQDFINMTIFDIKFMNPDRVNVNWYIRRNIQSGEIDLYPMFDNEIILNLGENDAENKISIDSLLKNDIETKSSIISEEDLKNNKEQSDYTKLLSHLLRKYPQNTKAALNCISQFSLADLKKLLDEMDGMTIERKIVTLKTFQIRDEAINKIYRGFLKKEKNQVK